MIKNICESPMIDPLKKENDTIRQKLLRTIKDFEVSCKENTNKTLA